MQGEIQTHGVGEERESSRSHLSEVRMGTRGREGERDRHVDRDENDERRRSSSAAAAEGRPPCSAPKAGE